MRFDATIDDYNVRIPCDGPAEIQIRIVPDEDVDLTQFAMLGALSASIWWKNSLLETERARVRNLSIVRERSTWSEEPMRLELELEAERITISHTKGGERRVELR